MEKSYSEDIIPWSCIEKNVEYAKVIWGVSENGIPIYNLLDENGKIIKRENY